MGILLIAEHKMGFLHIADEWDVSVTFMFLSRDLCFSIGKVLLCHLLSPTTSAASYFVHPYYEGQVFLFVRDKFPNSGGCFFLKIFS